MGIFTETLNARFKGILSYGSHEPDRSACALEVASIARGVEWSDDPFHAGLPDVRPINDAFGDDVLRTECITPVIEELFDWWPTDMERRVRFTRRLALRTVREILPSVLDAFNLHDHAQRCRDAQNL